VRAWQAAIARRKAGPADPPPQPPSAPPAPGVLAPAHSARRAIFLAVQADRAGQRPL
jgi:hypothetical protein